MEQHHPPALGGALQDEASYSSPVLRPVVVTWPASAYPPFCDEVGASPPTTYEGVARAPREPTAAPSRPRTLGG